MAAGHESAEENRREEGGNERRESERDLRQERGYAPLGKLRKKGQLTPTSNDRGTDRGNARKESEVEPHRSLLLLRDEDGDDDLQR